MAQNYIVFTEKMKLFLGSYEQQGCEIVTGDSVRPSMKWWKAIHGQANNQLSIQTTFIAFKAQFRVIKAAGGIVFSENKLLLIFKNKVWDLPKGWIEGDEFPMQAALREVAEECGQLDLTVQSLTPIVTHHLYPLKGKIVLKETSWFLMSAEPNYTLKPQTKEGITKVAFVDFTDAEQCITDSYPMIQWIWQEIKNHR
jgi:ADP-ribose pyrophosphatase YjhB (NUDIX family)